MPYQYLCVRYKCKIDLCACTCVWIYIDTCACRCSFGSAANGVNLCGWQNCPNEHPIQLKNVCSLSPKAGSGRVGSENLDAHINPLSQNGHIFTQGWMWGITSTHASLPPGHPNGIFRLLLSRLDRVSKTNTYACHPAHPTIVEWVGDVQGTIQDASRIE